MQIPAFPPGSFLSAASRSSNQRSSLLVFSSARRSRCWLLCCEECNRRKKTPADNVAHPDTSETVYISALALVKMLRHARSGVPMEVMGLMLGDFVDDYTISVLDVFAMPQSGTGVSVEAVDPVFQTKMLDMLKRTGRSEMVVGWYHSHPGFGCWLSSTDVATQQASSPTLLPSSLDSLQSFEALSARAVAVVIDPVQSVRGRASPPPFPTPSPSQVIIDAFRSTNVMPGMGAGRLAPTAEARQCTSNLGHLIRANLVAQMRGLGTNYYSLPISYKMGAHAQKMLQCVHKKNWCDGLLGKPYREMNKNDARNTEELLKMVQLFAKELEGSHELNRKEAQLRAVGRFNPKRRMEELTRELLQETIVEQTRSMINASAFR
ncbi:26S proteasome regulatory subunit RPN11 [Aphelenchoides fujianensis]|nr:26S proteasome regulatory subunit RPN11 [Aphelenchoides fujianensis]